MTTIATLVGITSGFILVGRYLSPPDLLATSLVVDASLAPLTALIAVRRGRSGALWTVLGFAFGAWAFAWVMLWGARSPAREPQDFPPASDAA